MWGKQEWSLIIGVIDQLQTTVNEIWESDLNASTSDIKNKAVGDGRVQRTDEKSNTTRSQVFRLYSYIEDQD